jgi:phosphate transport system permease protein
MMPTSLLSPVPPPAVRPRRASGAGDTVFKSLTWFFTGVVLLLLGGVVIVLVDGAVPALGVFGFGFVTSANWNPVTDVYGAAVPLVGTLLTSLIAMLIAVPASIAIAFFLTELCPYRLRRPIGTAIELLAAVPSIIYGIWGLFVVAPLFQHSLEPFLMAVFGPLPLIGRLFVGPPIGIGILLAGVILGVMVLPFITAVMRDVFASVPPVVREAAYGMGSTRFEVMWHVILPYCRVGATGAVMLGLGRALGETMAVTFVIGNAHRLSASLLAPGTTIASALANEFTEAVGDLYTSALVALGLMLFLLTFCVLAAGRWMLMRLQIREEGLT